jgi:hypothetical protein
LLGKEHQQNPGIFIQSFIKNRILSNAQILWALQPQIFAVKLWPKIPTSHQCKMNVYHFALSKITATIKLTILLYFLPSIIWYKWVNTFSCSALLVWQHTENNYTLSSSSTHNLKSRHYHYCQYYFTIHASIPHLWYFWRQCTQ